MALDRDDTLKKAEKLLRQGRLDGAIAEYLRVVEDQPRDWNTANMLGDLYIRANQSDKAVAQYARIADHLFEDGFYPKAAALYKKILKIVPDEEQSQLRLADISTRQGLLADAKSYYGAVAARRRKRGDKRGADEIIARLGILDPADFDARTAAARVLAESGDRAGAAARFRELHGDLLEKGRQVEALEALRQAVALSPDDREGRGILARAAVAAGDLEAARAHLDLETAGEDSSLLRALAEIELRSGNLDAARAILSRLLAARPESRHDLVKLAWALCASSSDAAFLCLDAAVDVSVAASEFDDAMSLLQEFVTRVPSHVPALLKLVEICVDGDLEGAMYEAQAQLADAYLNASLAGEARVIAEDLVAREPWEAAHVERLRRALVLLDVPDPDYVIAERLSGHSSQVTKEQFSDLGMEEDLAATPVAEERGPRPIELTVEPEPVRTVESVIVSEDATIGAFDDELIGAFDEAPDSEIEEEPSTALEPRRRDPVIEEPTSRPAVVTASPASKPVAAIEFDLTSALGELRSPAQPQPAPAPARQSLDDVFEDLRGGAARSDGIDHSAQHMKLARTYFEMGMLKEAVSSLKTAARSPRHRFEAGAMLGRLYKEHGDLPHAIEWFERAAQAPPATAEDGRALLYDLAVTLEEAGEMARALAVFLELQADDGNYRDVRERADRLARVQTGG